MEKQNNLAQAGDWYITDRPRTFDAVEGHSAITNFYKNCQKTDSWPKATFFTGKYGTGKTTLAYIIAMSLACKNRDENGIPCGECASCLAISNETFDRDVIRINGTKMSAQEVREVLGGFAIAPSFRDRNKVIIVDETQSFSPEALNTILEIAESPTKGQYLILNAMSKLPGKDGGALESRCKKWKLQEPQVSDIYMYLIKIAQSKNFVLPNGKSVEGTNIPDEFWFEPLQLIADNADYSYRKAINLFEQAIVGNLWTKKELSEAFEFSGYDEVLKMIISIANGETEQEYVLDTITGTKFQDDFNLIYKIVSDAEIVRVMGKLSNNEAEAWKAAQPKALAAAPYFNLIRDTFIKISSISQPYLKRADWQIEITQMIEKIRNAKQAASLTTTLPTRKSLHS